MRKEFLAFERTRGPFSRALSTAVRMVSRVRVAVVRRLIFRWLSCGSPAWHRHQAALAADSAAPFHMARRAAFYSQTLAGRPEGLRIYPSVAIHYPGNVRLGDRVVLNRGVVISAPVAITVEAQALVGPYVVINSGDHRYDDPERAIRGQGHRTAPIRLGRGCWVGAHAVVLRGVTIGEGAVVGAGAVVTRDLPALSIAVGVPARVIAYRDHQDVDNGADVDQEQACE